MQAYEAGSRLTGQAFPEAVGHLLDEGRNAGDRPGSLPDARARIDQTLAYLDGLAPDALDVEPNAAITHDLPNGMTFDFTAEQYARDWALAQFYFHIMSAYAIMRSKKVALGKADYISHLLPHLRSATAPSG